MNKSQTRSGKALSVLVVALSVVAAICMPTTTE